MTYFTAMARLEPWRILGLPVHHGAVFHILYGIALGGKPAPEVQSTFPYPRYLHMPR